MNWMKSFDEWVNKPLLTSVDLGRYRILWAVFGLLTIPFFHFSASVPEQFFSPPSGPFTLLTAVPPAPVLLGLELILALSLVAVLIGYRTTVASVIAGLTYFVGLGITYSDGRITHDFVLFPLVAFILATARWNATVSVDATAGRVTRTIRHWPVRYLALVIGLAMATGWVYKISSGWLESNTHAAMGHLLSNLSSDWMHNPWIPIASFLESLPARDLILESVDWGTVLLEGAVILCVLNYRVFRVCLAILCVFHLGVYLLFGIPIFAANVIVYAAFVPWGILRVKRESVTQDNTEKDKDELKQSVAKYALPIVLLAGVTIVVIRFLLPNFFLSLTDWVLVSTLFAGAIVGLFYIVFEGISVLRRSASKQYPVSD